MIKRPRSAGRTFHSRDEWGEGRMEHSPIASLATSPYFSLAIIPNCSFVPPSKKLLVQYCIAIPLDR